MNLPLKIFYTLKEASAVLNERLDCTEVNEDYFFHLGIKGNIRLGIFADPSFSDGSSGVLIFDSFDDFNDLNKLNYLKAVDAVARSLEEAGSILILNSGSVKDIYFNSLIKLNETYFDNVYSIDALEFAVSGELEKDFNCCQFFDELSTLEAYDIVFYSNKHNAIHNATMREKYLSFPEHEEDDDWKVAFWFNDDFSLSSQDISTLQSEREIHRDNCLILGEDLQLLLDGKCREPTIKHPRKHLNGTNNLEHDSRLHPKRENSINKIVLALAEKAGLDLSNHMTAYERLDVFAKNNKLPLPNKDTCGRLFKSAFESKESN
ncbi:MULTISPECIES: hypothetical protein [Acinetobacter]|uniref:hypothetical protein n=1 Tax=Acinetobacter TaxID=469 RepID=UPI001D0F18AC|nr:MULTISPECIES: hypothetical protein [Acinetobacter]